MRIYEGCCDPSHYFLLPSWPLVGNEGMNPQYTNVKVEGPSFLIPYESGQPVGAWQLASRQPGWNLRGASSEHVHLRIPTARI